MSVVARFSVRRTSSSALCVRACKLNRLSLLVFVAVLLGCTLPATVHATGVEVTVGVLAFRGDDNARQRWAQTTGYLTAALPGYHFRLVPLDLHGMHEVLERGKLDFILTNPGNYVELESQYRITRIATLKNARQGQVYKEFGAVIFTRADRNDIRELADLKHASLAAVNSEAFGGFQMGWRELAEAGIDPFHDLKELKFVAFPQDEVVFQVRDGKVDAGTVRTDVLERRTGQVLTRRASSAGSQPVSELTSREFEVFRLLADSKSVNEIAELLNLSPKTVGHHVTGVKTKLGITGIAGITRLAIRLGVISP
jgi:ABC-type phosphate/phosphonate transport system substrate-binding protein